MSVLSCKYKSLANANIVIIGAGAAGIAAATKLLKIGCKNVIILEAENRIGGRIYTVPFGDNVIDLGAQWCHGEMNNAVYQTVQDRKLYVLESTGPVYRNYKCVRSNKEMLEEKVAEDLKSIVFNFTHDDLKSYEGSLGSYFTDKFWSEVKKLEEVDKTIAGEFFENFKKFESSMQGSDHLFEVSGKGHLEYWPCEGDMHLNWKNKGYKTFLDILTKGSDMQPFGVLEKRILLNHKVKNIDWSQTNEVIIRCFNGHIITADHVICTTSLGVLKEFHSTLFTPPLPRKKVCAIEGLELGTVNKFFIEFREPFGPKGWTGICFLWQEDDLKALRDSELFWLESVFGFYRVSHQPRLLQGWIIGAHARHMECMPEKEVLDGLLWLFRKFLTISIPDVIDFYPSHWYSNSNFCGSYSFRSLYTDELRTGASDLASPLTDCNDKLKLQFAGEATHDHYYSTVHGAVESGWREAQRLVDFYNPKPPTAKL